MSIDLINEFNFDPSIRQQVAEDFVKKGLVQKRVDANVSTFESAGHDKGISYRFFIATSPNKIKSEAFDIEIHDEVEMIEWYKDRKNKPTERVTMLPPELLRFSRHKNPDGSRECIGGKYKEDYLAFKAGRTSPGLPLSRWERLSLAQVNSLASAGIFTVQQFASLPRDRIEGRYPKDICEAFEDAIRFINGQKPLEDISKFAAEVASLKQESIKREQENKELREKLILLENSKQARRGRPKRIVQEEGISA